MAKYYFFLSYAQKDSDRRDHHGRSYLKRFCADLRQEVESLSAGEVSCYVDWEEVPLGAGWGQELFEALQSCSVFVPLYSAFYFTRENCAKEWACFWNRLQSLSGEKNDPLPLVMPVLWSPPNVFTASLPSVVADLRFMHGQFGHYYKEEGIEYLMKLSNKTEYETAYQSFLRKFARMLVKAVGKHPAPPRLSEPMDFNSVEPLWDPSSPLTWARNRDERRVARFFFLAGRSDELSGIRENLHSYGSSGGSDWKPFWPPEGDDIASLVREEAEARGFGCDILPVDQEHLELLQPSRGMTTLLVDAWTYHLPRYSTWVERFPAEQAKTCLVGVVWNQEDPETQKNFSGPLTNSLFLMTEYSPFPKPERVRSATELRNLLARRLERHLQDQISASSIPLTPGVPPAPPFPHL